MSLLLLPEDLQLEILQLLSPDDTHELINKFHQLPSCPPKPIELLYRRLYSGRSLVLLNINASANPDHDVTLTVDEFKKHFSSANFNSRVFRDTRPNHLEFRFIRGVNDYTTFVGDLYTFNEVLAHLQTDEALKDYFGSVRQLTFHLDANTFGVESPTLILTAVVKTFISLLGADTKEPLRDKFQSITIRSTNIGEYFVTQWSTLLDRFSNVSALDLSDNIIPLDTSHATQGSEQLQPDLLHHTFTWPPKLKHLSLRRNLLKYISAGFIGNLPKTLLTLDLAENRIVTFGCFDGDFLLAHELPCLERLDLSNNHLLTFVNVHVFHGSKVTVLCRGTNIEDNNMRALREEVAIL